MVRNNVRGGGGGGGRVGGMGMRNIRPIFKKTFLPRHPFDLTLAEMAFPRVTAPLDDSAFTASLLKRSQELTPSPQEQTCISNLVTKVQSVFDNLVVTPDKCASQVS